MIQDLADPEYRQHVVGELLANGLDPKQVSIRELAAWLKAVERRDDQDGAGKPHQHPQPNPNMR